MSANATAELTPFSFSSRRKVAPCFVAISSARLSADTITTWVSERTDERIFTVSSSIRDDRRMQSSISRIDDSRVFEFSNFFTGTIAKVFIVISFFNQSQSTFAEVDFIPFGLHSYVSFVNLHIKGLYL